MGGRGARGERWIARENGGGRSVQVGDVITSLRIGKPDGPSVNWLKVSYDEQSDISAGIRVNLKSDQYEEGVSVFEMDGSDFDIKTIQQAKSLAARLNDGDVYKVTGKVKGFGADKEPLLDADTLKYSKASVSAGKRVKSIRKFMDKEYGKAKVTDYTGAGSGAIYKSVSDNGGGYGGEPLEVKVSYTMAYEGKQYEWSAMKKFGSMKEYFKSDFYKNS